MQIFNRLFFAVLWILVPALQCLYHPGSMGFIKKTSFYWDKMAKRQGPNVCPRETVPGKSLVYDRAWTGGSYCGSRTKIHYQCCEGFATVPGEAGCSLVKSIQTPVNAARNSEAGLFLYLQEAAGLNRYLTSNPKSITIFAPLDKPLRTLPSYSMSNLNYSSQIATRFVDGPSLLTFCTVEGRISLNNVKNDVVLTSLYNQQKIRMNVFPNGLITANCVPIVQGDIQTTVGLIHTLEAPLDTTYIYSITDTLLRYNNLRKFANYVVQGHFEGLLRSDDEPLTVLAPSDSAFDSLSHEHVHSIRYDETALKALVLNHVFNGVHCSTVLHNATLKSRHGTYHRSKCSSLGTSVSGGLITGGDKMASNGVIHIIDKILLPRRAKFLNDILNDLGLTTLASLVKNSGLTSTFTSSDSFTLFAPTNTAFQELEKPVLSSLMYRSTEAFNLLQDHIVGGRYLVQNLRDKQRLTAKGTRRTMRFKFFRTKSMVDNAAIIQADIEGLNGIIHIIDRVLTTHKPSIIQYLSSLGNFTRFVSALRTTTYGRELNSNEQYTVFAVPDGYIDDWVTYYHWTYNTVRLDLILSHHILQDTIYTGSLPLGSSEVINTIASNQLLLKRSLRGQFYAGEATVLNPDILCSDGVVHVINRLIQTPKPH